MLLTIAWRNVWRSRKRSLVILTAIAFGVWAGVFSMALMEGMYVQMVESGVRTRLGHVQIHAPGFRDRPDVAATLPAGPDVLAAVRGQARVQAAAGRAVVPAMAASPRTATGTTLLGVDPDAEPRVLDLHEHVREGGWFAREVRNPLVIGGALAERLDVGLGDKVVVQAQAADGDLGAGAFRVVGLFRTTASGFDETRAFARLDDVQRVFALDDALHEIVLRLDDAAAIDAVRDRLRRAHPELAVESWREISPELAVTTELGDEMLYVFLVIILIALLFGITNTMLMAVLERVRELGVLKALGMKAGRLFAMILLETLVLALVGGAVGVAAGAGTVDALARTGLDLSIVSAGLAEFGVGNVVRPTLPGRDYLNVAVLVILTALVAAVYPGWRAVRLDPVRAIRTP